MTERRLPTYFISHGVIKRSELFTDCGDLRNLIGRPTTTLAEAAAAALA